MWLEIYRSQLTFTTLFRLQDEASRYMKKIEMERAKIAELDSQIVSYQEQILEQKTRLGGVNAAQVNNKLIQKQIKVLDNRLDKCLLKYNETVAQNKVLRQKIDEYRRERIVFDVIYKKIERELHEKKKEMTAIINDSKNAYQARDKSQAEMRNLQSQAEKERSDFEVEFKELGDMIKQQQIMLEQIRLKQFERTNEDNVVAANVSEERSSEMAGAMANWAGGNKDKSILAPLSQEKIHSYEEMLLKIQVRTLSAAAVDCAVGCQNEVKCSMFVGLPSAVVSWWLHKTHCC
jgi:peptidoglycan hydrolase CwlO-like protein